MSIEKNKNVVDFGNVIDKYKESPRGKKFVGNIKCEDAIWGALSKGKVLFNGREKIDGMSFPQCELARNSIIIVVAESPHTAEYSCIKGQNVLFRSPLHKNDNRIKRYFERNFNDWFDKKLDYDIILVNAIQYQCSFGLPLWGHKKNQLQKNDVFKYTWENEPCREDLLERINNIIADKDNAIIINACTAELKRYCNSTLFVSEKNQTFCVYDETHPSRW